MRMLLRRRQDRNLVLLLKGTVALPDEQVRYEIPARLVRFLWIGQSALELMQNQFIVSMEDTEDTAALLGGGIGSDPVREQDVSRNRPEGS